MSLDNTAVVPALPSGASYYDYTIDQSLRFEDGDSPTLTRTPSSAGNRQTWTVSFWVKRGNIGIGTSIFSVGTTETTRFTIRFTNGDQLYILDQTSGTYQTYLLTTQTFRDTTAWYHIVFAVDSTQGTASNRERLYINGEEVTSWGNSDYVSQNANFHVNNNIRHNISIRGDIAEYFDGYLAEFHLVDGSQLSPTSFGETGTYGDWKPIEYTGSYGTNGFYLNFSNASSLGEDQAGSNDWTPNNIASTDVLLDSPTNNFATINPFVTRLSGGSIYTPQLSEGNLKHTGTSSSYSGQGTSTISVDGGKYYFEVRLVSFNNNQRIGIISLDNWTADGFPTSQSGNVAYAYHTGGNKETSGVYTAYGASYGAGDIIGVAYDDDNGTLSFYKNGVSQGTAFTGITTNNGWHFWSTTLASNTDVLNFGQDSSFAGYETAQGNTDDNGYGDFYYTPPSGYLALCTANLSDPTVIPSEHFNAFQYTGDGSTNHDVTGVGFQPDILWIKSRIHESDHIIQDAVRGANKQLFISSVPAEYTNGSWGHVNEFLSDGFNVDVGDVSSEKNSNYNNGLYISWNWKANGSGSSNTNGSITSTVSANQDAGISIVTYTGNSTSGATVGHGLSQAPEFIMPKNRDSGSQYWKCYVAPLGATKNLSLSETAAAYTDSSIWNDTAPTSSVFTVGSGGATNGSNQLAYCFHSVDGFSKIGKYTGNGSVDGPFVYTGFKPAFMIVKSSTATANWVIWDNERGYNSSLQTLCTNLANPENASGGTTNDFLANGLKVRGTTDRNTAGETYIYIAFAENPFKYTNAR